MTDLDASASNSGTAPATETEIAGDPVPIMAPLAGDPAMLGLPVFIVGSVALGLVLVGVVPASAVGASLPIILAATSIGLFIATIWAAAIGQSAVASIFGIFAGFWLSYAVLVLGLIRGWFGITALAAASTQELFLISWLVIVVVLTLVTLRLPLAFSLIFLLVDVALLLVLLGTEEASTGLLKTGGYVVLAFAAVGVYVFYGAASLATGGKGVNLGKPLQQLVRGATPWTPRSPLRAERRLGGHPPRRAPPAATQASGRGVRSPGERARRACARRRRRRAAVHGPGRRVVPGPALSIRHGEAAWRGDTGRR